MDNVSPGSTIPLFPGKFGDPNMFCVLTEVSLEENVKITSSQVHPIDRDSVPYNFSSTSCPLLHSAARALNLPARSSKSYLTLFSSLPTPTGPSAASSSRMSSPSNGINTKALDDKYTGHILVSGYNVSYVLPREFPPRFRDEFGSSTGALKRRASISEKNNMYFMAAVELWVPYLCKPPRAPYLVRNIVTCSTIKYINNFIQLSIPVPRCLSNQIKLRIFPPSSTVQSFASLSSAEDEVGSWDLTSDPHVTRSSTRSFSRSGSYNHFADDESSDSSTAGFSDGCGIQGTFPSTDRIRVRWATPSKNIDTAEGDGRRRVGVREVKAEMTCVVIGKGKAYIDAPEGVMMRIEYKGTCKGVWYGGVATLLGMDVGLEAKGSEVAWVQGSEPKWLVGGGSGYTGFDTGPHHSPSRQSSKEAPGTFVPPSSPDGRSSSVMISRRSSASSTTSLLRAPLPATNVAEYSFEGSTPSLTGSGTISSIGSLTQATPDEDTRPPSRNGVEAAPEPKPPAAPLTIHININDLLPPSKNVFTFNISGTILVTPRHRPNRPGSSSSSPTSDGESDPEPISLPKFTVFTADSETVQTIIRNEAENTTIEIYNTSGDLRDAQTRRTVLQKASLARCGTDGARIALRSVLSAFSRIKNEGERSNGRSPPGHPRTPNRPHSVSRVPSSSSLRQVFDTTTSLRPKRDGPLMIPSLDVTVTPLFSVAFALLNAYAVRVCLPAPADADSEWLEFGLAQPSPNSSVSPLTGVDGSDQPRVDIASASVDGVPVRFETSAVVQQEHSDLTGFGVPFEEMGGKEWITWVRVHVGSNGGSHVQVDYVVKIPKDENENASSSNGKRKATESAVLDVFLPTFQLPVGRLVVNIEPGRGESNGFKYRIYRAYNQDIDTQITSLRSNLTHQQLSSEGPRLFHYSLEELFYPRLSFVINSASSRARSTEDTVLSKALQALTWTTPTILSLVVLLCILSLGMEFRQIQRSLDTCLTMLGSGWESEAIPETTTVTSTILTPDHAKWWFGDTTSSDIPASTTDNFMSTPLDYRSTYAHANDGPLTHAPSTHPPKPTGHASDPQSQSLLHISALGFSWPIHDDLLVDAKASLRTILQGFRTVWRVCMKIYHYPLEPS